MSVIKTLKNHPYMFRSLNDHHQDDDDHHGIARFAIYEDFN
jgi:hypothetical protein